MPGPAKPRRPEVELKLLPLRSSGSKESKLETKNVSMPWCARVGCTHTQRTEQCAQGGAQEEDTSPLGQRTQQDHQSSRSDSPFPHKQDRICGERSWGCAGTTHWATGRMMGPVARRSWVEMGVGTVHVTAGKATGVTKLPDRGWNSSNDSPGLQNKGRKRSSLWG